MQGLQLVFGLVDEIKYSPILRIRAILPDMDGIISPWAQVLTPRSQMAKTFDPPVVGEQVALLMMDDGEFAICIGSVFSDVDATPADKHQYSKVFDDGTRIDYDPKDNILHIDAKGDVTVACKGDVFVQASKAKIKASKITLDGDVAITKGLTVARDAVVSNISFIGHTHAGVSSGPSRTAPPTP